MRKLYVHLLMLTPVLCVHACAAPAWAAKIYWNENSSTQIRRSNLNGTLIEQIVVDRPVRHVTLDPFAEQLYWTEVGDPTIYRGRLDGTHIEPFFMFQASLAPEALAIDAAGAMIYVTAIADSSAGHILRIPLSGAGAHETLINLGPDAYSYGIAIDAAAGMMYWTQDDITSGRIRRAALDGSGVEDLVPVAGTLAFAGIALDPVADRMYWSARALGRIQRAHLNGSQVEDLATGLDTPRGIALDAAGGKVYWVERFRIQRSDLDGQQIEELVTFDINVGAMAMTLDLSPAGTVPALSPAAILVFSGLILAAGAVIASKAGKRWPPLSSKTHLLRARTGFPASGSQPPVPVCLTSRSK